MDGTETCDDTLTPLDTGWYGDLVLFEQLAT